MDSRTVLAGLLDNFDPRQIVTFTYGTPGTWDFELGRRVAKQLSVEHHAIDPTSNDWSWDIAGLQATAKAAIRPMWVFDRYVRKTIAQEFGSDALFWTGFMGDALGGNISWSSQKPFGSWAEACDAYAKQERFVKELHLTPAGYDPARCLPASPRPTPKSSTSTISSSSASPKLTT